MSLDGLVLHLDIDMHTKFALNLFLKFKSRCCNLDATHDLDGHLMFFLRFMFYDFLLLHLLFCNLLNLLLFWIKFWNVDLNFNSSFSSSCIPLLCSTGWASWCLSLRLWWLSFLLAHIRLSFMRLLRWQTWLFFDRFGLFRVWRVSSRFALISYFFGGGPWRLFLGCCWSLSLTLFIDRCVPDHAFTTFPLRHSSLRRLWCFSFNLCTFFTLSFRSWFSHRTRLLLSFRATTWDLAWATPLLL